MKKILGLDLGTNSIGWALVQQDFENKQGKIIGLGSRIIPMSQDILGKFDKGNSISQTAERTRYRGIRRIRERHLLRRDRLHRILNVLGFLPEHYATEICFDKHYGQFKEGTEPKLAWKKNQENKFEFLFQKSFEEMLADFKQKQPDLLNRKNIKGEYPKIPYDWTIYYLRKKALTHKISKEELAWLILNFNQKRGYYQARGEDDETANKKEYVEVLKIVNIEKGEIDKKNNKRTWYNIRLSNDWIYSATFTTEPQWLNTEKEFLITEELDDNNNVKIKDSSGKEKRKITPLPTFEEIELMSQADKDKIYTKIKAKTELTISNSEKTVGAYIYDTLLQKPNQKIRGKLIRTIDRQPYKDELKQILKKQIELQPYLFSDEMYNDCVRELYRNNESQQLMLSKRDFIHLFLNDIIFYQRPLRSQKSSIGNCSLEFRLHKINKKDDKGNPIKNVFEKDDNGKDLEIKEYLKAIPKSNPYYQEFRLLQWIKNLIIYKKNDDSNVTSEFLNSTDDFEKLLEFLNNRKEIEQNNLLKYLIEQKYPKLKSKEVNAEIEKYRWNYVEDNKYPCNQTKTQIQTRLGKVINAPANFLGIVDTKDKANKKGEKISLGTREYQLWHIIYSVTDKDDFEKALKSFSKKYKLDEASFVKNFIKFPPFKKEYGLYSEKAIKKLLPLMRFGNYWKPNDITNEVRNKTNDIRERLKTIKEEKEIENVADDDIPKQILKSFFGVDDLTQGLRLYQASYLVYGHHSELSNAKKWSSIENLKTFLNEFKQHSLRNPIVEQLITETLRVVHDIWQHYGKGTDNFFDEIHIELGREMKNTAEDRKRMTKQITENEKTNLRIKLLLYELKNDNNIENIREYSPTQQEILKIYEDGVLSKYSEQELKNEKTGEFRKDKDGKQKEVTIYDITKSAQPTKAELTRYKLWLEQKYRSPYTGKTIPLSKLFTTAYEIEHIIPQSRYFDDSFNNKVICEAAVNKIKDNQLGLEFIKNHGGEIIDLGRDESVEIFKEEIYITFVKEHYEKNRNKRNKLLLEEIPEKMIERQLNDTRYISKYISSVLSNIVRAGKEDNGINSKNLIPGNGKITATLKQDWGLNDVWNEIILPRFERMNTLTNSESFTSKNKEGHAIPTVPLELSEGFQKKRIDHRHHALDALVIACMTRDHVQYLNNENAKAQKFHLQKGLAQKLRKYEKVLKTLYEKGSNNDWRIKKDINGNQLKKEIEVPKEYYKPWNSFTIDAKNELEKIVVSFKQNLRVINKTTNRYKKFENGKKVEVKQKGMNWAIRKPMHKEFVFGKVNLPWVQVPKGKNNVAIRRNLDTSFDLKKIKTITDIGIQNILKNYLEAKDNNPILAFSPEGIEDLNKNITTYNNGNQHQPIFKVRTFEISNRFPLGQKGNKVTKYVEAAKGTNLFFVIYEYEEENKKTGKKETTRLFETIPLNEVIEHQKQEIAENTQKNTRTLIPLKSAKGKFLFYLSPNDLVYVPTAEELSNNCAIDFTNLTTEQIKRIYKFTDGSGAMANFIPATIAEVIFNLNKEKQKKIGVDIPIQNEIGIGSQGSKNERAITGEQIKSVCIKLKVDRLGNIIKSN